VNAEPPPPAAPPPGAPPPPPPGSPAPAYPPPSYQPPTYSPPRPEYRYAGFWARVGARLIDLLVGLLFTLPGLVLVIASLAQIEENREGEAEFTGSGETLFRAGVALVVVGSLVFFVLWMRKLGRGQSWGQKALAIRLVGKQDGRPIGAWKAFLRYLVAQLVSGVLFGLGYWWMIWDRDNQTWQDKIVGTVVIEA
jgi:uncharacterized RDD family membrane protein YckC